MLITEVLGHKTREYIQVMCMEQFLVEKEGALAVSMNVCQVFLQTLLTEGSLVMTNRGMKDTVHLPQANYLEYFPLFLLNNGICKKYLRHSPFSHRRRYHESSLLFCGSKRALCKALPPLPYGRQLLLCGDGDGSGGRQDIPAEIFKSASRVSSVGGARIG